MRRATVMTNTRKRANGNGSKATVASSKSEHTVSDSTETLRAQLAVTDKEFLAMGELGAMYYGQGLLDKAQTIFEGLVELDPESPAAHSALGALYTRREMFDEAIPHLDRAVQLSPAEIAPYVNLAEIYIRLQEPEAAVENLKMAIALDPDEQSPAANRARAMALGIAEALRARGIIEGEPTPVKKPGGRASRSQTT